MVEENLITVHNESDKIFTIRIMIFEFDSIQEYYQQMTGSTYTEWFTKILNFVELGSVITLTIFNAPYHLVNIEKFI